MLSPGSPVLSSPNPQRRLRKPLFHAALPTLLAWRSRSDVFFLTGQCCSLLCWVHPTPLAVLACPLPGGAPWLTAPSLDCFCPLAHQFWALWDLTLTSLMLLSRTRMMWCLYLLFIVMFTRANSSWGYKRSAIHSINIYCVSDPEDLMLNIQVIAFLF